MKQTIRKTLYCFGMIMSAVSYYILFFTHVFDAPFRQLAYMLSGHNGELSAHIASGRVAMQTFNNSFAPAMLVHFSATVQTKIQFGPYMNFTVYMLTFFIVTPLFLISTLLLQKPSAEGSLEIEQHYWQYFKRHFFTFLFVAFGVSAIGNFIAQFLAGIFKSGGTSANQVAIQNNLQSNFIISVIPIVILAPIIEELVFRGVILSGIKRLISRYTKIDATKKLMVYKSKNIQFEYAEVIAIVLSATFFALIHLTSNINQWMYFPAYFGGGLALGGIYVWNKERLYSSIIIHAVYNGVPIFLMAILKMIFGG